MTDDSPSTNNPDAGDGSAPAPFEPDRTVMRPREPQPPTDAIDDGDDGDARDGGAPADPGETQPLRADGPPPPPPTMVPADAPAGGFSPPTTMTPVAGPSPVPGFDDSGFDGGSHRGTPGPDEPDFPMRAGRAGTAGAVVAIGTGLLAAAVAIASSRARSDGDLDWSNYGVAVGGTAVLLAIAVLGALAGRKVGGRAREEVVTWPGVVGILGTAVAIGVGIDSDDSWVAYLIAATMVVLAAIGYVAARRAAFVVVAILGLALAYAVAFDDFVADSVGDDHPQVIAAVLVALFVVVVTLLGWALPSRAVSGVFVGAFGLAWFTGILVSFIIARYLGDFLGSMFGDSGPDSGPEALLAGPELGFHEGDVWWVLALAALLVVLWALAAAVSNHSGFTILAIAALAILVPLASVALAAEHPTWWAAALAGAGAVVLLGGVGLARIRGRRTAAELSA